jgi:DNA-binding GntR family transcriptional regulator
VKATRQLLREQVKEGLLARILSGTYEPGERLVETRLAKEFGTSQVPVREALRDLEALRFVESEPFRGARVRAVSLEELLEIYPIRSAVEEVAAREAATRLQGDVGAIRAELEAMVEASARGDLHEQVLHDVEFHRLIAEASGNSILLDVWLSLRVEGRTMVTALRTDISLDEIASLHEPIVEALAAAEPELAADAMRRHFTVLGHMLKEPIP